MHADLTDLRLFLRIAETGSITHGAAAANMALASASERIRGLETTLGTDLLVRGRRGVAMTPAGTALAHHAQVVLQQISLMNGDLAQYAAGLKGHIRLLSNTAALAEILPLVLPGFLASHPLIDIDLEERPSFAIVRAVLDGFADLGIVADSVDFGGLETCPFAVDRLVLVVPRGHGYAGRRDLSFRDVLDNQFVGLGADSALQQHLSYQALQLGRTLKLRIRLAGFDAVCRMVEAGVGLAVLPETAVRRCRKSMKIALVRLKDPWSLRRLVICARRFADLPIPVQELVSHLRQHASGIK